MWKSWFRTLQTVVTFVFVGAVALIYIHTDQPPRNFPDFSVFYAAGAHGPIYDPVWITSIQHAPGGLRPFAYPPPFVIICRALRLLPFDLAFALWSAVSGTLFIEGARRISPRLWFLSACGPAVIVSFRLGQTPLLIGGLITLAFTLRSRPLFAGVLYGLALSLKPQVLLLIPVLLILDRSWRTLAAMALAGAAVCAASLALGPKLWFEWLRALETFSRYNDTPEFASLGAAGWWWWAVALLAVLGIAVGFRQSAPVRLATFIGGSLLISPHAMAYEQAMLAPAASGLSWPVSALALPGVMLLLGQLRDPVALAGALLLLIVAALVEQRRQRPSAVADPPAEVLAP